MYLESVREQKKGIRSHINSKFTASKLLTKYIHTNLLFNLCALDPPNVCWKIAIQFSRSCLPQCRRRRQAIQAQAPPWLRPGSPTPIIPDPETLSCCPHCRSRRPEAAASTSSQQVRSLFSFCYVHRFRRIRANAVMPNWLIKLSVFFLYWRVIIMKLKRTTVDSF